MPFFSPVLVAGFAHLRLLGGGPLAGLDDVVFEIGRLEHVERAFERFGGWRSCPKATRSGWGFSE